MINKRLDDIDEEDLLGLISNGVLEGRTIEYKRDFPKNDDSDKKEFLADSSSFANSSGGDLLFGIDESNGTPIAIVGLQSSDLDLEKRRLESILASGLSPRIRYEIKVIACKDGRKVLIIRIEKSWVGPHRVIFKGSDKFYGRNSAGKYPLDVEELRTAFTLSNTAVERIRAFRTDRIISITNEETQIPLIEGPKIVLHCAPMGAFTSQQNYQLLPFYEDPIKLRPMKHSGWSQRLNLEGLVAFAGNQPSHSYVQLFRNGIIEAVEGSILNYGKEYLSSKIPSVTFEQEILKSLGHYLEIIKELGLHPPILVGLALTQIRGFSMGFDTVFIEEGHTINRDTLILPEMVVQEFSASPETILKPTFDLIWNSCGYPKSRNFDENGSWKPQR